MPRSPVVESSSVSVAGLQGPDSDIEIEESSEVAPMRYVTIAAVFAFTLLHVARAGEQYSCNMAMLSDEELGHYQELAMTLHSSVQETKELRNGFAFRLPPDALVATSQWISYERKCCPFFDFELEIPKDSGPIWLRITGERGIKDFIRTEFEL
jgi:hypothetical protein